MRSIEERFHTRIIKRCQGAIASISTAMGVAQAARSAGCGDGLKGFLQLQAERLLLSGGQEVIGRELQQHQAPLKPEAKVVEERLQQLIQQLRRLGIGIRGRRLGGGWRGGKVHRQSA